MTDADKGMNSVHFGSNPADTLIRINPEISNPGSLVVEASKVNIELQPVR